MWENKWKRIRTISFRRTWDIWGGEQIDRACRLIELLHSKDLADLADLAERFYGAETAHHPPEVEYLTWLVKSWTYSLARHQLRLPCHFCHSQADEKRTTRVEEALLSVMNSSEALQTV